MSATLLLALLAVCVVAIVAAMVEVVGTDDAMIVFRHHRPHRSAGPGVHFILPFIEHVEHCSTVPEQRCGEVSCFSRELVAFRARVAVTWRIADPLCAYELRAVLEDRIGELVGGEVIEIVSRRPLAEIARHVGTLRAEIEQRLPAVLSGIGVEVRGFAFAAPEVPAPMLAAWAAEPIAIAERSGRLAEAQTRTLVAHTELATVIEELLALEGIATKLSGRAAQYYESRTRREAVQHGSAMIVMSSPETSSDGHTNGSRMTPILLERPKSA